MKCQECDGKGFKEYNSGLLQVECEACKGIGEVEEVHPELHEILYNRKADDNSLTGTKPDNTTTGSRDTGKSKQPKKPKVKNKLSKRAR